ncbi:MAG TPA: hypothetical protein VF988_15995, partial [Verrucomicrobiae bacterium]
MPLKIRSLGSNARLLAAPVKSVSLLGCDEPIDWKQEADGLVITCPKDMPFRTSVGFKIGPAQAVVAQTAGKNSLPD